MAYSNNGSSFGERFPITTSSLTFFGNDIMMLMSFSDDKIYISFRDAVIDGEGKKRYPRPQNGDNKNTCILTKERVAAFLRRIRNAFIPKLDEFVDMKISNPAFDKAYSVAVPTNAEMTNFLAISTGKPNEKGWYEPEVSYMKDISTETRMPAEVKTLVFSQKVPVFTDYDPKTGNYVSSIPEYPQVDIFVYALEEFLRGQTKGQFHGAENINRDRYRKTNGLIEQIAMKNGVPVNTSYGHKGPGNMGDNVPPPNPELKEYTPDMNMLGNIGFPTDNPF